MIYIYISEQSNRINYTFDLIFSRILDIPYKTTTSLSEIEEHKGAKLIYAKESVLPNIPFIEANNLLFEDTIKKFHIEVSLWKNYHIFFETTEGNSLFPFDLFACSFYMTSRYEEYQPYFFDKHGRFEAMVSVAYKNNFLHEPIVNQYAYLLKNTLLQLFPELIFPEKTVTHTFTLDIDNAFAYQHKGVFRSTLSLGKKLASLQLIEFNKQLAILSRAKQDPYDSYDKQIEIHKKYNIKPIYFFLVGNYGTYDKNISHRKSGLKNLVKKIANTDAEIGIHPSYDSYLRKRKIKQEKKRLETILEKPVHQSRQHYLKLKIPATYQQLIELGITDDYSMGFASKSGFRAGICTPFPFFDLTTNESTSLIIHPFCIMDTTLKVYQKIRSEKILKYVEPIFDKIKAVNGNIHVVFHNESIGEKEQWKNWKNMYQKIVLLALDKKK